MSEKPLQPADAAADDGPAGVVLLARSALNTPSPAPEAEQGAREQALAQFRDGALSPRPLHETVPMPPDSSLPILLGRMLKRLLGR